VERLKLAAPQTSKLIRAAALAAALACAAPALGATAHACGVKFVSPEAALDQGIGAYQAGFHGIALPALTCAAEEGLFLGQYHLARLYADSASPATDHGKAYELYRTIVEEHAATIDVDDDPNAPFVGKALAAYAGYWLRGLPEVGLEPNAEQAAFFLQQAATFFRDRDAQFELAKLYLKGEGVPEDRKKALGWLTILTQEGHAGAQAFFADLLWRGKSVQKDEKRALALITIAVENAPADELIWIEDIYQSIYCGTPSGTRKQAEGTVASFRRLYAPRSSLTATDRYGLDARPTRSCVDGEVIKVPRRDSRAEALQPGNVTPQHGSADSTPDSMMNVRGQSPK
jgi:hypothetical protein